MEVSKISEQGIRLKSKSAQLAINPMNVKGQFDGIILTERSLLESKLPKEGSPIIIVGPGEYEIKGIKFNGFEKDQVFIYTGRLDNINVSVVKSSLLNKIKDNIEGSELVIVDTDIIVDQKAAAALNANVLIFYGQNVLESARIFGKETSSSLTKYTVSKDKLPSELEVVILS